MSGKTGMEATYNGFCAVHGLGETLRARVSLNLWCRMNVSSTWIASSWNEKYVLYLKRWSRISEWKDPSVSL